MSAHVGQGVTRVGGLLTLDDCCRGLGDDAGGVRAAEARGRVFWPLVAEVEVLLAQIGTKRTAMTAEMAKLAIQKRGFFTVQSLGSVEDKASPWWGAESAWATPAGIVLQLERARGDRH